MTVKDAGVVPFVFTEVLWSGGGSMESDNWNVMLLS
jgi:hypothetical protein